MARILNGMSCRHVASYSCVTVIETVAHPIRKNTMLILAFLLIVAGLMGATVNCETVPLDVPTPQRVCGFLVVGSNLVSSFVLNEFGSLTGKGVPMRISRRKLRQGLDIAFAIPLFL